MKDKAAILDLRRRRLREKGVPEAFVEALAHWRLEPLPVGSLLFGVLYYVAALTIGFLSLFGSCDFVYARLYRGLVDKSTLFGTALVFPMAMWSLVLTVIFLPLLAGRLVAALTPRAAEARSRRAFVAEMLLADGMPGHPRMTRPRIAARGGAESAEAYLDALIPPSRGRAVVRWADIGIPVTLLLLGLARYDYWSLDGTRLTMMSLGTPSVYDLSQATRVNVACTYARDAEFGNGTPHINYNLYIGKGPIDLMVQHDVVNHLTTPDAVLDRLMPVDSWLRAHHVPVNRISLPDLDPAGRACVRDLLNQAPPAREARLRRLLFEHPDTAI
ncbi:hypothetical protein [Asticcacaulis solisilvae]|uniref:hypothetical protein n=1 Tax=Asticcacaulis solisilvae TaxID=1217274 RepID=UPI003FD880E1